MSAEQYSLEASGAFVETFTLPPYQNGPLDGLSFAVKDNIDIAGQKTSYGSKSWGEKHTAAVHNAVCIEQLLGAGATCSGKTVSDEFTYSLQGENHFYGTPLNPIAPERIPGGSSSGSASAVACRLVDFAIGTDSGGSIRVPASFCGIWGMRPTLHRISEAGVLPFTPSVSTVGAFSNDIEMLDKVMRALLRSQDKKSTGIKTLFLLEDAFALADPTVRDAVEFAVDARLKTMNKARITRIRMSDIAGKEFDLKACNTLALRNLQTAEFASTTGGWIEQNQPELSPSFEMPYQNVKNFNRKILNEALFHCEYLFHKISEFLEPGDLICFPTTPTTAPFKGSLGNFETAMDFYDKTMAFTSFAGAGRLPEISMPIAQADGVPVGVSLAAATYQDEFLIDSARQLLE